MNRRTFLKGLTATAACLLLPEQVVADPERRIWALDQTMIPWNGIVHAEDWDQLQEMRSRVTLGDFNRPDGERIDWFSDTTTMTLRADHISYSDGTREPLKSELVITGQDLHDLLGYNPVHSDFLIIPKSSADAWRKLLDDVQS